MTRHSIADLAAADRSSEHLLFALEAAGGIGTWDWDVPSDLIYSDRHFAEFYGVDPERAIAGVPISEFMGGIHPEDREAVGDVINNAIETGEVFSTEYRTINRDGEIKWVLARGRCTHDEAGKPLRFPGAAVDITERKAMEAALLESEARFEAIVNSIDQLIWATRPDGYHDYYNARWYEYTGVPAGSTDGEAWNGMFHEEDQERAWALWRHSLETGDPYHIEYRLRHHSGEYRWVIGRAQPFRNEKGQIMRWYGTCTDIHDLKIAQEQKELIARELSHRIKNIFALSNSLIMLSARSQPEHLPFAKTVRGRLEALASAHEYVRPDGNIYMPDANGQTVRGLLETLLAPYRESDAERVGIEGCDTPVSTRAATSFALVIHELATNSMKYGALSEDAGAIAIACTEDGESFMLTWRESGGPEIDGPPEQQGFGSLMLDRAINAQLGARLDRAWEPSGLVVTIAIPLGKLAD